MYVFQPSGAVFNNKNSSQNLLMKLVEYIKETRGEMKHVNWPTRNQAINYTLLVIGLSLATALLLAIADYVFGLGLEAIILK